MNWLSHFDERQQKEIEFSIIYSLDFAHGTDGHNAKLIIARMAKLLNEVELLDIEKVNRILSKER